MRRENCFSHWTPFPVPAATLTRQIVCCSQSCYMHFALIARQTLCHPAEYRFLLALVALWPFGVVVDDTAAAPAVAVDNFDGVFDVDDGTIGGVVGVVGVAVDASALGLTLSEFVKEQLLSVQHSVVICIVRSVRPHSLLRMH